MWSVEIGILTPVRVVIRLLEMARGVVMDNARKPPTWKYPCVACSKPVRSNQKGILCDGCC